MLLRANPFLHNSSLSVDVAQLACSRSPSIDDKSDTDAANKGIKDEPNARISQQRLYLLVLQSQLAKHQPPQQPQQLQQQQQHHTTSHDAPNRTQRKLWLQRQSFLADDKNCLDHPANMKRLTKEMERVNREYHCLRHFQDPLLESLRRLVTPSTIPQDSPAQHTSHRSHMPSHAHIHYKHHSRNNKIPL
ncbi:hypothetical protein BC940DRAFT_308206 [Gongronella butleri]|nr:hypothetical protein BC940DRAFT_308206 [Gongronella butleri]